MCRLGWVHSWVCPPCAFNGWRIYFSLSLVFSWCRAGMSQVSGPGRQSVSLGCLGEPPVHGGEMGECGNQGEKVLGTLEEQGSELFLLGLILDGELTACRDHLSCSWKGQQQATRLHRGSSSGQLQAWVVSEEGRWPRAPRGTRSPFVPSFSVQALGRQ